PDHAGHDPDAADHAGQLDRHEARLHVEPESPAVTHCRDQPLGALVPALLFRCDLAAAIGTWTLQDRFDTLFFVPAAAPRSLDGNFGRPSLSPFAAVAG